MAKTVAHTRKKGRFFCRKDLCEQSACYQCKTKGNQREKGDNPFLRLGSTKDFVLGITFYVHNIFAQYLGHLKAPLLNVQKTRFQHPWGKVFQPKILKQGGDTEFFSRQ